jgi:PAS domain S-box-containing protein
VKIRVALIGCALLAITLSIWGFFEHRYPDRLDQSALLYLHMSRGAAASMLIALSATWLILREHSRHRGELERAYERYQSILDNTPEAVVLFDKSFRVAEWNTAAERLYGIGRKEAIGKVLVTVPLERWNELRQLLGRLSRGQEALDYESERLTAKGDRIPVALSYARMPPVKDQPPLYLELAQDIRARLQMRDRLLEIEKLTLMGHLAAGTAHHLNTPLTAMLLQTEMLSGRLQGAEEQAELASIKERIRFCQAFVQNLLGFARRPQLQHERVSLCEVVEAVASLLRPSLAPKKVGLRVDLDGLRRGWMLGDPNQIEAAFSALLSNAVDAVLAGGTVHVHGRVEPGRAGEIYIDDNGPGIPDELSSSIFEPFFTTKPAGQGTGLGLPTARNIVEQHGGTLQLENRKGGGVRTTVSLPLLAEAAVPQAQETAV